MQMGLLGQAARETANSAKELSKGNVEASQSAMNSAKEGNLANQSNKALLQITAAGVGPAADVMKKNIETNDALYQGAAKTAKAMGLAMDDVTKVLGAQKKAIEDEQKARNGATSAMIAVQSRLADANAAANNLVRRPLMTGEANTQLQGVANRFSQGVKPGDSATTTAQGYAEALKKSAAAGGESKAPTSSRTKYEAMGTDAGISRVVTDADKLAAGGIQGAGKVADKVGTFIADVMTVKEMNANLKTRDEGTLGKTGQVFEPEDFIGKVAKGEMVLTPDQAKKFMEGAKTEGISDAVKNLGKMMPAAPSSATSGGFNLSNISKEISTSVSSVTSGSSTTKQVQSDDSKQAQTEMASLKKQFEADWASRKSVIIDGMAVEDRKFSKVQAAMKADDEAIKLKEDYARKQEELQKKIDAGITWEIEKKSEQVEETKTFVKEQADLLKISNNEMLAVQETAVTEKIDIEKEAKEKIAELSKTVEGTLVKPAAPVAKNANITAPVAPVAPKFDRSKFTMPTMDQLTIGPDGMPKISAKPQAQTIPAAVKPADAPTRPSNTANSETRESVAESKPAENKPGGIETKTATLDDVAKLLSSLNTTMKQVATAASETNNKLSQQVKATKAMSGNVHGAT
jgi:hypothetical protein